MPTYDYKCSACGHRFDEMQSFSEPPLTRCPKCKKNKLTRLFGGGGAIIFKGQGFYETDYRRAGEKKPAEGAEPAATESKPDAGGDAKAAESSPPPPPPPPASDGAKGASGGKGKGAGKKTK